MKNLLHDELLHQIKAHSGKGTQHTFLDSYLGNSHPRYAISLPVLRSIAKEWMKTHKHISRKEFAVLLSELIQGESSTEKVMAGILLGYSTGEQRKFNPKLFDEWLNHLVGWAEVDAVCTGKYWITLPDQWDIWKPLILKFSKSKNINKRRASLVLFCSPLSQFESESLCRAALKNVDTLKGEKDVLITKAISWVLRSMYRYNKKFLEEYLEDNASTLPKIALRETLVKLKTGKKNLKKGQA
jgi:3-methyladenine DNA glycosylase AlkD